MAAGDGNGMVSLAVNTLTQLESLAESAKKQNQREERLRDEGRAKMTWEFPKVEHPDESLIDNFEALEVTPNKRGYEPGEMVPMAGPPASGRRATMCRFALVGARGRSPRRKGSTGRA